MRVIGVLPGVEAVILDNGHPIGSAVAPNPGELQQRQVTPTLDKMTSAQLAELGSFSERLLAAQQQ